VVDTVILLTKCSGSLSIFSSAVIKDNYLLYGWYFLSHNAGKEDVNVTGVFFEPVHSKYIICKGIYNDQRVLQIAIFLSP
jgi:hypothetical protein